MELLLASTGSYPRVGDTPEEQILRRTIAQWEKGEKTDADLAAAQDRMTEMALREQTAAGLDVVTDGQVRWYDPISHLAGRLSGVEITGLLRLFDTNVYFRQPVVRSKPARKSALLVEEFRFAQQKSERPVKAVLTGPYTLAHLSLPENGLKGGSEALREGYTEALAEEIAALAAAGAAFIQVDEPALLRNPADFDQVERSMKQLAARKGSAQLELALYFGDPGPLYDLLQDLPVDVLGLDFTYNPNLTAVIAGAGSSRELALGLVDGRNTKLEDPATVARQMEQIFRKVPAARAYLAPSCGLEYLPRDRARLKLKNLTTIKKTFLGSHA
jgi:5-methyltetrahydropteroyltriglutamate--homocysteine methyltransferase